MEFGLLWKLDNHGRIKDIIFKLFYDFLLKIEALLFNNFFVLIFQGFSVSLFYCFLNSEVRQVLRNHLYRWRDERNIGSGKQTKSRRYVLII